VLTTLNQLEPADGEVSVVVMCHARELAVQIGDDYKKFSKYLPAVKSMVIVGGVDKKAQVEKIKAEKPHIIIGTPGRVMDLAENKLLDLSKVKYFVVDECDKVLEQMSMRAQVQKVFFQTPMEKQVMMYSATLSGTVRTVCKKFMHDAIEIAIEDERKLTLHGLQQYYVKLEEADKNAKLAALLDALDFNQVVIFVSSGSRARELNKLLTEANFPSEFTHGRLKQEDREKRCAAFRSNDVRIMVTTNLFGRGIDVRRVNVVINYDFPKEADKSGEAPSNQYLHRVGRAGRFGSKGLAISFVTPNVDEAALKSVQDRFEIDMPELPDEIDSKTYK